jgi:hypothetical protein
MGETGPRKPRQMRTTPLPPRQPLLPSPVETLAPRALPPSHAKSLGKKMNEDLVGEGGVGGEEGEGER